MSSKNNNSKEKSMMNLGDVSTIRDILFGSDIQSIEERFEQVSATIGDLRGSTGKDIEALKKETEAHLKSLDKRFEEKMAEIDRQVKQHVTELEKQILNVSKSDKHSLAEMLQQLSVSLIKGEK